MSDLTLIFTYMLIINVSDILSDLVSTGVISNIFFTSYLIKKLKVLVQNYKVDQLN